MKFAQALYKFFSSVKLAVVVILALGVISAIGTFVEADYDALTAQKLVYKSIWMYSAMALLVINLVFSAVDRMPWRRRHIPFLVAHVGIIVLIFGAYVTQKQGIDGSMVFSIGETNRWVSLPGHTDLIVYHTEDGNFFKEVFREEVDFLVDPPTPSSPLLIPVEGETIKIYDYYPYASRNSEIIESTLPQDGPALRFQLKNDNVNVIEWVTSETQAPGVFNMGPAKVILSRGFDEVPKGNVIMLVPHEEKEKFHYLIFTESKGGVSKKGVAKVGDVIQTGWMGLEFRALKYFQHSRRENSYKKLDRPNAQSVSAMLVEFQGKQEMLGLNSLLRLFTDKSGYIMTYQNRRVDIGFDLKLEKFHVGRYPGTMMAQSYESEVSHPEIGSHVISMNEPLKHRGYTFYQASFQENEFGEPTASVLSVNDDPGRFLKYFGSLLILLGSVLLFYFKKKIAKGA